jgi:hypothetical protein
MATTTTTLSDEATKAVDAIEESTRGTRANLADAAGTVRGVASDVAARLPDAAASTRSAIDEADRQLKSSSDEMLSAGTSLTFGLAIGLLIGGANRLLVAAALVPVAAMGLTLLGRANGRSRKAS